MWGPQMGWQLLLGWALLLGQPVVGDSESDSIEQPPSEEPVTAVPVLGELDDPVSEPEEEVEEPRRWWPGVLEGDRRWREEPEERKPPSDEELEEMETAERDWLEQEKEKPCSPWFQYLQQIALGSYNKNIYEYHKPYGKIYLKTQKAIGTMVHLKMMLVKTNCTSEQQPVNRHLSDFMRYNDYGDYYPNCEPVDRSEQECSFTFFSDKRVIYYSASTNLLHKDCKMLHLEKKSAFK